MTALDFYAPAIIVGLSLLAFVWLAAAWKTLFVDVVRDDFFELRRRLFLYSCDAGLVDDDAHRLLRQTINSLIRYAHELTFARYIVLVGVSAAFERKEKSENLVRWEQAVSRLPKDQREQFQAFHTEVSILIIRQIVRTSILLRLVVMLSSIWDWLSRGKIIDRPAEIAEHIPTQVLEEEALLACAA